jgi:hypothetical protein
MTINLTHLLIDIEDQRHYNSCVGQAITTYLEAIWKKFDGNAQEFSPAFIWQVNKSDPKANTGIYPLTAFAKLKTLGCCLEKTFPYVDSNLTIYPPANALKEAKQYRIGSFKSVQPSEIKGYLDKGLPVCVAMGFGNFSHMVNVFGYDDTGFLIVNSWGAGWMQAGTQVIQYAEFNARFQKGAVITGLKWQALKTAKKWFKKVFSTK